MTNHHGMVIKYKDWGIRRELSRTDLPSTTIQLAGYPSQQ